MCATAVPVIIENLKVIYISCYTLVFTYVFISKCISSLIFLGKSGEVKSSVPNVSRLNLSPVPHLPKPSFKILECDLGRHMVLWDRLSEIVVYTSFSVLCRFWSFIAFKHRKIQTMRFKLFISDGTGVLSFRRHALRPQKNKKECKDFEDFRCNTWYETHANIVVNNTNKACKHHVMCIGRCTCADLPIPTNMYISLKHEKTTSHKFL